MLPKLYLDTGAIAKRYIREKGSGAASLTHSMADAGNLTLSFSLWNVGEAIGVIDRYEEKGWITREQGRRVSSNLAGEMVRLVRIMALEVLPMNPSKEELRVLNIEREEEVRRVSAAYPSRAMHD